MDVFDVYLGKANARSLAIPANEKKFFKTSDVFFFIVLIIIAFAVRYYLHIITGGQTSYLDWAWQNYLGGITPSYFQNAELLMSGKPVWTIYPIGYPLFLAILKIVGITDWQKMRLVQSFIDSFTVIPIFYTLMKLGVRRSFSFLGALTYAAIPYPWAMGSTFLLAEWCSPAVVSWTIFLTLFAFDNENKKLSLLIGALIAIGALFRPDLVLLAFPVAFLVFIFQKTRRARIINVTSLLSVFFLIMLAHGVFNKIDTGEWMLTSSSGGSNLWEGLGELPNNYGYYFSDKKKEEYLKQFGLGYSTPASSRFLTEQYFLAWRNHPAYVVETILNRWKNILRNEADSDYFLTPNYVFSPLLKFIIDHTNILLLLALAISYRYPRRIFIVALPLVYAMLSIGITHYEARYVRYASLTYLYGGFLLLEYLMLGIEKLWQTPEIKQFKINKIIQVAVIFYGIYFLQQQYSSIVNLSKIIKEFPVAMNVFPASPSAALVAKHYSLADLHWQTEKGAPQAQMTLKVSNIHTPLIVDYALEDPRDQFQIKVKNSKKYMMSVFYTRRTDSKEKIKRLYFPYLRNGEISFILVKEGDTSTPVAAVIKKMEIYEIRPSWRGKIQ